MHKNRDAYRNLIYNIPIKKRLPLLIILLLALVIIIFSYSSYISVRKASLDAGIDRVKGLATQFSSLFGQSANSLIISAVNAANSEPVVRFVKSGGKKFSSDATRVLDNLGYTADTLTLMIELRNAGKERILTSSAIKQPVIPDKEFMDNYLVPGIPSVSEFYKLDKHIYWAAVAPVTFEKKTIGYLIKWRLVLASKAVIKDMTKLLGADAELFIGNSDGNLLYDLNTIIENPPVDIKKSDKIFEYSRIQGTPLIAASEKVRGKPWIVLVELKKNSLLEASRKHLAFLIIAGLILLAGGFILALIMSRSITKPLGMLKEATSGIALGNYSYYLSIEQKDELGDLANAFNIMLRQIVNSRSSLESSLKEKEVLLREIHHRVKNNLQIVSSLLNLQTAYLKDPAALKALQNSQNRIKSMAIVHEKLYQTENFIRIKLDDYLDELLQNLSASYQVVSDEIIFIKEIEKIFLNIDQAVTIGLILTELVSNSIKHAFNIKKEERKNEICVTGRLLKENDYLLSVKDNGDGFPVNYDSGSSPSLGLKLVDILVSQINGRIELKNKTGTQFDIYFSIQDTKKLNPVAK
ncbi:MAG TPA: histidine kinase dimerization/phosphoacceptor domain -containing protein, partial [Ignavibacteriaceae bacterium]|nr:histidine kinase dimerization/phosphoacceptor domain -containing protein [Ignavibacteriaceae bacterium]